MFRQVYDTTSLIQKKSKKVSESITLHADGISIADLGSMRLSNLPHNIRTNLITSLKILFLLARFTHASEYFSSPDHENNYRFDGNKINVSPEDCGTAAEHAVAYPYEAASKLWRNPAGQAQQYSAQLFRGAGEMINSTIENCITNIIQQQVDAIDAINVPRYDYEKARRDESDKIFGIIMGSVMGSLILLACLPMCLAGICTSSNNHNSNDADNLNDIHREYPSDPDSDSDSDSANDIEKGRLANAELNHPQEANDFQLFHRAKSTKKIEKMLTHAERLEKITLDISVPRKYTCPVTLQIMTYPCITNDGHNYEQSALEKLKNNNENCPMNREFKVSDIILNNDLRSDIISFLEEQEKIFAEKKDSSSHETENAGSAHKM